MLVLSVCGCVCVYMCVRSHISHHNFVRCCPILTKRYMEITSYRICIYVKYHEYRLNVKVKVKVLRHITSYMTCFVKRSILNGATPNLVQLSIRSHIGRKSNYIAIGGTTLMLWLFLAALWLHYE